MRIVCRTGQVDREMDSPIKVGNSVGYTNSSVYFSYKVCLILNSFVCSYQSLLILL